MVYELNYLTRDEVGSFEAVTESFNNFRAAVLKMITIGNTKDTCYISIVSKADNYNQLMSWLGTDGKVEYASNRRFTS